ncbi:MAG: hypothetical protein RLZZ612_1698 [Pseudomonadota bacterium]|jgi:chromatin remodeling complex protein RSC6
MATEKKASPRKAAAPKAEVVAEPAKKKTVAKKVAEPVAAEPVVAAAAPAKKTSKAAAPAPAPAAAETKGKANSAFMKPLTPSAELAAVVGKKALPRTEVTKKIWEYIKKHELQDQANKRNINADKKLKAVFGKDQVTMFEMTKLLSAHLK